MVIPAQGSTRRHAAGHAGREVHLLYGVPTMFIAEWSLPDFERYDLSSVRTGSWPARRAREMMKKLIASGIEEDDDLLRHDRDSPGVDADPHRRLLRAQGQHRRRVHPHLEVKVVDPLTVRRAARQPGEFCTKGYSVMLGYWEQPDKTAEVLQDGWMHTGDIAVMDEHGYVQITGRIKDMVIRGGENIYPREIEEFSTPTRTSSMPRSSASRTPSTARSCAPGSGCVRARRPLTAEAVREFATGKLAHYKIPRYVHIVDEFPMTVTGKVRKVEMREKSVAELGWQARDSS
jgi:fatty-acyl-CoA synthase